MDFMPVCRIFDGVVHQDHQYLLKMVAINVHVNLAIQIIIQIEYEIRIQHLEIMERMQHDIPDRGHFIFIVHFYLFRS